MIHLLFLHNILLILLHIILLNKGILTQTGTTTVQTQPEVQLQTTTLTRQPTLQILS